MPDRWRGTRMVLPTVDPVEAIGARVAAREIALVNRSVPQRAVERFDEVVPGDRPPLK
jgi:hypothetical protein